MNSTQTAPSSTNATSGTPSPAPGQTPRQPSSNKPSQQPGKVPSNEEPELNYEADLPTPDKQEP